MGGVTKIFVTDIDANQEVSSSFVVAHKEVRVARNGTPFLTLKLADKTGEIVGRVWEKADETAKAIATNGAVFVRARSERFRDELQLQILEIRPLSRNEIRPSDYLPMCPLDLDSIVDRLNKLVSSIKRRHLHQLMKVIAKDRHLMNRFKLAPAAKSMHHAYLGGLLEHTVSVAGLVSQICKHYPELDRDILIVGAILHDIGKVDEFVYDLCIDYSHQGRLLGHMILGFQIFEDRVGLLKNFPAEDRLLIKHMILSHHGETQFGAVKVPMTREAFVLHYADDLDAKMSTLTRILSDSKAGNDSWTSYQPLFERFFFRGLPAEVETGVNPESSLEEEKGIQLSIWQNKKDTDT
ncbi:MAG: 3'-5' exoribonuclease YhaM family protein [Syntrophobacteraceae bacterium]